MAATIEYNNPTGAAVIKFVGNGTISVANLTTNNTLNGANVDTTWGMHITSVFWTGPWSVYRGANLVLDLSNSSYGSWELEHCGIKITDSANAAITANTSATSGATLILKVTKQEN